MYEPTAQDAIAAAAHVAHLCGSREPWAVVAAACDQRHDPLAVRVAYNSFGGDPVAPGYRAMRDAAEYIESLSTLAGTGWREGAAAKAAQNASLAAVRAALAVVAERRGEPLGGYAREALAYARDAAYYAEYPAAWRRTCSEHGPCYYQKQAWDREDAWQRCWEQR